MPVPDLRLAICERCRRPERRASGAAEARPLLDEAKRACAAANLDAHCRLSQCLNCCEGGHTVRVELHDTEVALIGIRTVDEIRTVVTHLQAIGEDRVPPSLERRVYQRWYDGRMVFHRSLSTGDE